jgi:hypothetical protein
MKRANPEWKPSSNGSAEPRKNLMQIILVQAEIEKALTDYVLGMISIRDDQQITIDLSATRGTDGFKALIDIVPLGQEVLVEEPTTLGIADKIADAKAEAAPVRRTRRTAAQIAADNAAAAEAAAEGNPPTTDAVNEDTQLAGDVSEDKILGTDTSGSITSTSSTATTAASPSEDEPVVEAEAEAQVEAEAEEAPAPRQSLFGNLNAVKN